MSLVAAPAAVADPVVMPGDIACASPGITSLGDCSHPYSSRRRPAATAGCPAAIARYERQCV